MFKSYAGTRFVVWIRVIVDLHNAQRGFSILGRELRAEGYEPVRDEMIDLKGNRQAGRFWVVKEDEVMRAIPELKRFAQGKSWFFPVEFCDSFVRPYDYLDYPVKDIKLLWEEP